MPIDELHIAYSKLKLANAALGGLPLIAAALALSFGWLPGTEGGFTRATGWVALLFFGACLGVILWRLFGSRGDVVTMTSDGLVDQRVVSGAIAWRAIRVVSVWELSRQKVIVLKLDREIEKSLALKPVAKWTSGPNRA